MTDIKIVNDDESTSEIRVTNEAIDINKLKNNHKLSIFADNLELKDPKLAKAYIKRHNSAIMTALNLNRINSRLQVAYPYNNEYYRHEYKDVELLEDKPNVIHTDNESNTDTILNGYNNEIIRVDKRLYRYDKSGHEFVYCSEYFHNGDNYMLPGYNKIHLNAMVNKYMSKMYRTTIKNSKNYISRFIIKSSKAYEDNYTVKGLRNECIEELIEVIKNRVEEFGKVVPIRIQYNNNKINVEDTPGISDVDALTKVAEAILKLPMNIINNITAIEPNIKFIDTYCKYDEKTHAYMLNTRQFLNSDEEYDKFPESLKNLNIICRHEYLQYTEINTEKLSKECYVKGKCRYCGSEISLEVNVRNIELPGIVYVAIDKFIKLISLPNVDTSLIKNELAKNIIKLYNNVVNNKGSLFQYDEESKLIVLGAVVLLYIRSKINIINQKKEESFTELVTQMMTLNKFKIEDYKRLSDEFEIIKPCGIYIKLLQSFNTISNNKLYHPVTMLFKTQDLLTNGIKTFKESLNNSELTTEQKIYLKGYDFVYKYHRLIEKIDRDLWSRRLLNTIKTNVKDNTILPDNPLEPKLFLPDNEIKKLSINIPGFCPINQYHEYEKNVCKYCGYIKGKSYKNDSKYITDFIYKYYTNYVTDSTTFNEYEYIDMTNEINPIILKLNKNIRENDITLDEIKDKIKDYKNNELFNLVSKEDLSFIVDDDVKDQTILEYFDYFKTPNGKSRLISLITAELGSIDIESIDKLSYIEIMNILAYMVNNNLTNIDNIISIMVSYYDNINLNILI